MSLDLTNHSTTIRVTDLHLATLTGLNLQIKPNERVAIIGASGSGKTVLLRCLLGLLKPDAGTINLLGQEVRGRPVTIPGLGVAFQQPGLFDSWDIRRNLSADNDLSATDMTQLLADVDLQPVSLDAYPNLLSGGQQKRVSLLRALNRGTQMLLLDEPTSGLDPLTGDRVIRFLNDRLDAAPRTLLVITHNHQLALSLCDRILLLDRGRLADITPPTDPDQAGRARILRKRLLEPQEKTSSPEARKPRRKRQVGLVSVLTDFLGWGLPIAFLPMLFLGALLVLQSAQITWMDVSNRIPAAVVVGTMREISPLVVGLLLASRIAARICAEIGGMSYTAQLDSMRILGLPIWRTVQWPFLLASLITFPVYILFGALAATLGGALAADLGLVHLSIGWVRFWYLAGEALEPALWISCLVKGLIMALMVSQIAFSLGARPTDTALKLGRHVTLAAILCALGVVIVDILISILFFGGVR